MPILQIKFATPFAPSGLQRRISAEAARITAAVLRKDLRLTAVVVEEVPAAHWFVGGPSLEEQDKSSFFLDIKVVDGTNTKDEKAAYAAEIFGAMSRLLGALHPESYVHVHDVKAEAYGFGGLTQEYRYIAGRLRQAA